MNRLDFRPRRITAGFTIIELLVALGVTAILVTLMVSVTVNVLNAWNRSSSVLSTGNQARLLLDQLSLDFEGAVIRRGTDVMLAATIQPNQTTAAGDAGMGEARWTALAAGGASFAARTKPFQGAGSLVANPASNSFEDYRFGQAGVWLRLFSIPSDTNATVNRSSAPRAISYQMIRRRLSGGDQIAYQLFRSEVQPFDTGGAPSTFSIGYDLFTNASPGYNTGLATDKAPGNIRRPNVDYVIANDVIDFGVRLLERSAAGVLTEVFPFDRRAASATTGYNPVFAATTDTTKTQPTSPGSTAYGYPEVAEVYVRILSSEGVRLINAFEGGQIKTPSGFTDAAYWWELAEQNSKVFTRRIEIRSSAL